MQPIKEHHIRQFAFQNSLEIVRRNVLGTERIRYKKDGDTVIEFEKNKDIKLVEYKGPTADSFRQWVTETSLSSN